MRGLAAGLVCLGLALSASAEVFVNVYYCDGTTPLSLRDPNTPGVYSDIMVGTHLVLIVSSDEPAPPMKWWWGALLTSTEDCDRGRLGGRGFNPNDEVQKYDGSCLEAAGYCPLVTFGGYHDFDRIGFDLMADCDPVAGDWFVFDYYAEEVGACSVQLFDRGYGPDEGVSPEEGEEIIDRGDHPGGVIDFNVPDWTLTLTHVPSSDFNSDHIVNFRDYAWLASQWRREAGLDPAAPPLLDLDADGLVGPSDIAQFSDFWLGRTDCNEPVPRR